MIEKIKIFLVFLFIAIVAIGISLFIVLLVCYDINYPVGKLWIREKEKLTIEVPVKEEKVLKESVVKTDKGVVKGTERKYKYSPDDTYYAFQGIPYAQPPIGDLRFKEPRPVSEWEGVLDATKEKSICPQKSIPSQRSSVVIGSEDCLYLNVYTPENPETNKALLKPVMIWIHGGGFQFGSGNTDFYGPDFLIKNDVVLVTFNYRLGVLGFLNLQVEDAPGNAGIKDQVAVLKWVKNNISKFGGNPDNVTLFGEDAGAVSIQLLMITKSLSNSGLFHKVILQSGSIMNPWAIDEDPDQSAIDLCKYLGINAQLYGDMAEALRKVSVSDLILAQDEIITEADYEKLELYAFVPSLEDGIDDMPEKNLLIDNPLVAFAKGELPDIPSIVGLNNAESNTAFLFYPEVFTPEFIEKLNNLPNSYVPPIIIEYETSSMRKIILDIIKKFYFKDDNISWKNLPQVLKLMSDRFTSIGTFMTAEILRFLPKTPLYVYEFTLEGELNYFGNEAKKIFDMINRNFKSNDSRNDSETNKETVANETNTFAVNTTDNFHLSGAGHFDELGYLFLMNKYDKDISPDKTEYKIREQMAKMWTNFAKNSNPNSNDTSVEWSTCTEKVPAYLKIGETMEVINSHVEAKYYMFWKALFISVFQQNPDIIINYLKAHKDE